jgi:hypothetical protein
MPTFVQRSAYLFLYFKEHYKTNFLILDRGCFQIINALEFILQIDA